MLIYNGTNHELSVMVNRLNAMTVDMQADTSTGNWSQVCQTLISYEFMIFKVSIDLAKKDFDSFCENFYLILHLLHITDLIRAYCENPRKTEIQSAFNQLKEQIIAFKPSIEQFCLYHAARYADRAMNIGVCSAILLLVVPGASILALKLTFAAVIEESMRGAYHAYWRYKDYFSLPTEEEQVPSSADALLGN